MKNFRMLLTKKMETNVKIPALLKANDKTIVGDVKANYPTHACEAQVT